MPLTSPKFYMWQNKMCITYLLRLNQIQHYLTANGWENIDSPENADYIIIGACGAFMPNFKEYSDEVKKLAALNAKIVIYGCLPIIDRRFFKENTPRYDFVVPTRKPERIEQIVESPKVPWAEVNIPQRFRKQDYVDYDPNHHYILIQEGCTDKCTFCPHRLAIGAIKSRPLDEIVSQVKRSVADGATHLILEGNDCGSWGRDLTPQKNYFDLLNEILEVSGDCTIRVYDFAPKWTREYGEALIDPRITDLKIPIQSTSARLLSLLGRDPYVKEMGPFLKKLRRQNEKAYLRTEIIVGFPTSTEEELMDTLSFVAEHFDRVACYSFDLHPSSPLAKKGLPLLDEGVIEQRLKLVLDFFKDKPQVMLRMNRGGKVCKKVALETEREKLSSATK